MCKRQSQKSILHAHELKALRWLCIKNQARFIEISAQGSGTLPEISVCEHSSHPQMQVSALQVPLKWTQMF